MQRTFAQFWGRIVTSTNGVHSTYASSRYRQVLSASCRAGIFISSRSQYVHAVQTFGGNNSSSFSSSFQSSTVTSSH